MPASSARCRRPWVQAVRALASVALAVGVLAAVPAAGATPPPASSAGLASRPYMGWSSWSTYRCQPGPSEALVEQQAAAMHRLLQPHGYRYVNVDDCWYNGVDAYGRWAPDPARFPDGIAATAAYVHSLGLKFGIYLIPGIPVQAVQQNTPVEGTPYHARDIIYNPPQYASTFHSSYKIDYTRPGAQAFIDSYARLLASWGVDFVKLDSVAPGSSDNSFDTRQDVQAWSTALRNSGRQIWLELSWHLDIRSARFWRANANGWRVDDDIECYNSGSCSTLTAWSNPTGYVRDTVLARFFDAAPWAAFAGHGGWSNLDSLDIGNGTKDGLTPDERQTAMTLWAIAGSELYTGDDLTGLDSEGVALLTNDEVIAVDQAGSPGSPVPSSDIWSYGPSYSDQQVWRAREPDGSYAVALFNLGAAPAAVTARWNDVGFCGTGQVRDLWAHRDLGSFPAQFTATLAPHASRLLRVTPAAASPCPPSPPAPAPAFYEAEASGNTLSGGASVSSCSDCSGGEKAGNLYNGGAVQFNSVTAPAAGTYRLTLYYASGDERTGFVSVNGGPESTIGFFPATGGFSTVGTYTVQVQLNAGQNTIKFASHPGTYSPDLDRISIAPAS